MRSEGISAKDKVRKYERNTQTNVVEQNSPRRLRSPGSKPWIYFSSILDPWSKRSEGLKTERDKFTETFEITSYFKFAV